MEKIEYFYRETNKHIRNVQMLLNEAANRLVSKGRLHDVTKFNDEEKDLFAEAVPELCKTAYGSDEYKRILQRIKPATDHHNTHNRHHPEYFNNKIDTMTLMDLIEMVCDWCAAVKRNPDGDVIESIEINQKRFGYSDELKSIMDHTACSMEYTMALFEEHEK